MIDVEVPTYVSGLLNFQSGAKGTIITTFDVWSAELPFIEIYGSEGTLSVPDPNTFGGPVRYRRHDSESFTEIPLIFGYRENSRGLGLADMAMAIRNQRKPDVYKRQVYTIRTTALDFITEMNAFSLVNRMFMLYAINYVDEVTVHAPDTDAVLTIIQPDTSEDETARATFKLDGVDINRKAGNLWYQSILSITSHGALPKGYTCLLYTSRCV